MKAKYLKFGGILSGIGLITVAVINILDILQSNAGITSDNYKAFVLFLYQIFFGLLMIAAELRKLNWLKYFPFLSKNLGKGLFYVAIGTLATGTMWYDYLIMIVLLLKGFGYVFLSAFLKKKLKLMKLKLQLKK